MKNLKHATFILAVLSLMISGTIPSCKKETAKPKIPVAFGSQVEYKDLSFFQSMIGEKDSFLVFYNDPDCGTCAKIIPVLEKFIAREKVCVYGYEQSADELEQDRIEFLKQLGSKDGINLSSGRLVAFVEGKAVASINGIYNMDSVEKIRTFCNTNFALPDTSKFKSAESGIIKNLEQLKEMVDSKKKFLLLLERDSCPDCRALVREQNYNAIEYIFKNSTLPFYKITTEEIMTELSESIFVEGKEYTSYYTYLNSIGIGEKIFDPKENQKQKTETLEILTALGQNIFEPETITFNPKWRNLPAILSINFDNIPNFPINDKDPNYEIFVILQNTYKDVYKSKNDKNITNDTFPEEVLKDINAKSACIYYFGADNRILGSKSYLEHLSLWIKKLK